MDEHLNQKIRGMRRDYSQRALDEHEVNSDPIAQFSQWMEEAIVSDLHEAHAMSLATCGKDGQPSLRIVLLRGFDPKGFVFFTNYQSRKGRQIGENSKGALALHWAELERQVRIEGNIEKTSEEESDKYYHSRPPGNRLGAWASPQSEVVPDREFLEDQMRFQESVFNGKPIHRPPHWGGYRLNPKCIEFWQGRPSRLHDRVRYTLKDDGKWKIERLAP